MPENTTKASAKPRNFDQLIELWTKATTTSRDLAVEIANYAISHFYEHGQTALLQKFLTALETTGKNYVRKASYLLWLNAFAPIKMDGGKLIKDKEREFDPALLEKALKVKFFDFAPEKEKVFFDADKVVVPLTRVVNSFDRENMIPMNDNAVKAVELAHQMVANLKRQIALLTPPIIDVAATTTENVSEESGEKVEVAA